jgi:hypothetical protein
VLVEWEPPAAELPRLGEVLILDVLLPQREHGERTLRCRARVVRICSGSDGAPQVAFSIDRMDFRAKGRVPVRSVAAEHLMTEVLAKIQ